MCFYFQSDLTLFVHPDNDECSDGKHNCSQTCTNTDGSFTCGCNNSYVLDGDGTTCNGMYNVLQMSGVVLIVSYLSLNYNE